MNDNESVSLVTDEVGKAITIKAEEESAKAYVPDADLTKPDFDVEATDAAIEGALYMELKVWKARFNSYKQNMMETHAQIPFLKSLNKRVNDGSMANDLAQAAGKEKLAPDELEVYNELQRNGITMEMQMQSFLDKYDVNMAYIDKCLARIDERLENEAAELENSKTSVKNLQLIKMIERHVESIDKSNPKAKDAIKFAKAFTNVCNTRTDLNWIGLDALGKGNHPKRVVRFYKEMTGQGRCTIDEVARVFRFSNYPAIKDADPAKVDFFWWYLTYLVAKNEDSGKVSISALAFKERVVALIQNVNDINSDLFDLKSNDSMDASCEHCYFDVIEGDNTEGINDYLGRLHEYVELVWDLAFNKG